MLLLREFIYAVHSIGSMYLGLAFGLCLSTLKCSQCILTIPD